MELKMGGTGTYSVLKRERKSPLGNFRRMKGIIFFLFFIPKIKH
jgi:hypothetical protein